MPAKKATAIASPAKSEKKAAKTKAPKGEKVKRAPSPFIIFCSEKRPGVKAANPDASFGELGKLLGALWAKMSDAEKKPYVDQTAAKKAALAK